MNLFDLRDDVAVVIGASGVLGGAIASGLAAAGAKVAVLGRNSERGQARTKTIKGAGGTAAFFTGDAQDRQSLTSAHRAISELFGSPTILVNAAGGNDPKVTVTADRSVEQIAIDDWKGSDHDAQVQCAREKSPPQIQAATQERKGATGHRQGARRKELRIDRHRCSDQTHHVRNASHRASSSRTLFRRPAQLG